jgi:hypothetical protein
MKPIIRNPQQGRTVSLVGDVYRFLATGEDTNGKYALIEAIVGPGGGPPPHVHSREEEGFYILEGEITFTINGERVMATAGMFARLFSKHIRVSIVASCFLLSSIRGTKAMWTINWRCSSALAVTLLFLAAGAVECTLPRGVAAEQPGKDAAPPLIRSARSGLWSAPGTWEGGKVPSAGSRVLIRAGHTITYDLESEEVIRSIRVAGTLTFACDKDTRLDVGLVRIQPGEEASEEGFDCNAH